MPYVFPLLFGFLFGSFANAWIWRAHEGLPMWMGRSMCPKCRKQLRWHDNIPLISFCMLKGKCRRCGKKISWQYPLVELVMMALFVMVAYVHSHDDLLDLSIFRDLTVVFFLLLTFVYDLRYMEITDEWTLWPAGALFMSSLVFRWQSAPSMLIGAAVGAGFFYAQYVVSKGRWIGGGDIRLGAFMGIILGWPRILVALFIAYILGAAASIILIALKKKKLADTTSFGTYLTVATGITMFVGETIIRWYSSFLYVG